ncbi:hypothetical protein [Aliirhizobium cellulosilyticum]|uniref:Uncharacterized protein n=1 Tax=Aliirhizobium cellulosilyticum TaxID=393664 RepID=A0A7W6XC50_9HYPH|nr:hypothetical protein [Rhizobium cellulosilyticum]MBB4351037.1 hypothetical protein [Rhizobium cellulosilyticum]MBB4414387.1 hypothetical protein [Rhizobium cellulosilyticum]MBB4449003.1 hypothetical protein [Rhizobium cellulosilyticum]
MKTGVHVSLQRHERHAAYQAISAGKFETRLRRGVFISSEFALHLPKEMIDCPKFGAWDHTLVTEWHASYGRHCFMIR